WQTTVHFKLAVASALRPLQQDVGYVAGDALHIPVSEVGKMLGQQQRHAVGFLTTRSRGTPQAELTLRRALGDEVWENRRPERLERVDVAEKLRFMRHQRLDHLYAKGRGRPLAQAGNEVVQRRKACLLGDRRQACFHQVLFAWPQHHAGPDLEEVL